MMGILADALNPRPRAATNPLDAFWYQESGYMVERGVISGIGLSPDTILRCGTVLAAVRFRGNSWAICSPSTFRKTEKGREEVPGHYSQAVLRNPNAWQTGYLWRQLNGVWLALWGNAYSEMIGGPRAVVQELRPLHPMYVRAVDQRSDGTLVYRYEAPGAEPRLLGQERVLHFRDLTTDGISGIAMYKQIRSIVGIALLAEQHAGTSLKKGARLSGLLIPTQRLNPEQKKDLQDSVNTDLGGTATTGTLGVLPHGVTFQQLAATNRDTQFMELSDGVVGAILRFLGVPGFVVGYQGDKANTYASAKETAQEALRSTVLPIIENIEEQEEKALLPAGGPFQIKHNMDILLRVNLKDRYDANYKACGGPWVSRNEIRRLEDLDPDPEPGMDRILTPVNMATELPESEPEPPDPGPMPLPAPPSEPDEDEEGEAPRRVAALRHVEASARRVLAREAQTLLGRQGGGLLAKAKSEWRVAVDDFYRRHGAFVAAVMMVSEDQAAAYCAAQAAALKEHGVAVVETWEPKALAMLVGMALRAESPTEPEEEDRDEPNESAA